MKFVLAATLVLAIFWSVSGDRPREPVEKRGLRDHLNQSSDADSTNGRPDDSSRGENFPEQFGNLLEELNSNQNETIREEIQGVVKN